MIDHNNNYYIMVYDFASQIKLNVAMLEGIVDELDFCCKLAKEESVILLPGDNTCYCYILYVSVIFLYICYHYKKVKTRYICAIF